MINTSSKQTGSAHAVIIVVLVIALLGALGFAFWNTIMKKDTSTTIDTSKTSDGGESDSKTDTRTYRNEAINIEFNYPKDWIKVECENINPNPEDNVVSAAYFGTTDQGLGIVDGKSTQLCGGGSDFPAQMVFTLRQDTSEGLYLDYAESSRDAMIDGVFAKKYVSRPDSKSTTPGLESTTYVVKQVYGGYITATYNRYPAITNGLRDNSDAGLQAFVDVVEKSLRFLRTVKQVE